MLPKKACDVNKCEVARIMKLTSKGDVEPLPFIVPRKFEGYQPDVYPPTYAGIPALTGEEWRQGQNSNPYLMSLEPGVTEITKKGETTTTPVVTPVAQQVHAYAFYAGGSCVSCSLCFCYRCSCGNDDGCGTYCEWDGDSCSRIHSEGGRSHR